MRLDGNHDGLELDGLVDVAWEDVARQLRYAMKQVGNAYGCFAGCTAGVPGGGPDKHTPVCREAREAFAAFDALVRSASGVELDNPGGTE